MLFNEFLFFRIHGEFHFTFIRYIKTYITETDRLTLAKFKSKTRNGSSPAMLGMEITEEETSCPKQRILGCKIINGNLKT